MAFSYMRLIGYAINPNAFSIATFLCHWTARYTNSDYHIHETQCVKYANLQWKANISHDFERWIVCTQFNKKSFVLK